MEGHRVQSSPSLPPPPPYFYELPYLPKPHLIPTAIIRNLLIPIARSPLAHPSSILHLTFLLTYTHLPLLSLSIFFSSFLSSLSYSSLPLLPSSFISSFQRPSYQSIAPSYIRAFPISLPTQPNHQLSPPHHLPLRLTTSIATRYSTACNPLIRSHCQSLPHQIYFRTVYLSCPLRSNLPRRCLPAWPSEHPA
ncbi:hypothetical protein M752DRAFT_47140 [Aspergillus phoenicis ATCC 13157]|uniref:Uncharacterized protein n=1 Tax=Aspergillus phoenicis ATCC 13157 TaxID=1353007 RepID=A0A370PCW3_ASPPH|nr:hypothetical protein M752DRAFT_47140 [Aspergillus phoenicis ATCC 13157]